MIIQASVSLLTVYFHRNFGLRLGHFPSIFIPATALMFSVSCPNHSNVLLLMTITIGSTLASCKIISSSIRCSNRRAPVSPFAAVSPPFPQRLWCFLLHFVFSHVSKPFHPSHDHHTIGFTLASSAISSFLQSCSS